MFLVFLGTLVAGSLGAVHFVVVHVVLGKPIDENIREDPHTVTDGGDDDV
jgi:hypothetical protein